VGASDRHVVVVGGGIAGLAAAVELVRAEGAPRVTVLEAQPHLGGKIRTTPFAGLDAVDEGADAFLARVPWGVDLARRVGLGERLTSPAVASASVWWEGLQRIPDGLLLGLPTDVVPLARSRLLSWRGKLRAALEPVLARSPLDHDSLGRYVRARFGDEVQERLVDPLVGSIYAADTDRFSLAAVPQIADLAATGRSVLLTARRRAQDAPPAPPGPVFHAPRGGMGELVAACATAVRDGGGTIRTGAPCTALERDGRRWRVDGEVADAVVLACPAPQAARLLGRGDPGAIGAADVVVVTLAVPASGWPDRLHGSSGYLVPKPVQRLVTAVSFGSQKWAHWRSADRVVLRVSLGRDGVPILHLDDDRILDAALAEVGGHLGLELRPEEVRITRWQRAFPQYRPHHHRLVADLEAALPPGVALAGASYHGIGVPACIRSGQRAAELLTLPPDGAR